MDLIELCEKQPSLQEVLASFNDQNVSDYVVVYLRLLTSGYLQREQSFFQHFIEGGRSVKEFCQQVGFWHFHIDELFKWTRISWETKLDLINISLIRQSVVKHFK